MAKARRGRLDVFKLGLLFALDPSTNPIRFAQGSAGCFGCGQDDLFFWWSGKGPLDGAGG
jgi:hypothetical protein